MFTGFALIFGYGLLKELDGCIFKTEGALQQTARRQGRWCFMAVLAAIVITTIWTPFMDADIAQRWFSWPNIAYLSPVPVITAAIAFFRMAYVKQ